VFLAITPFKIVLKVRSLHSLSNDEKKNVKGEESKHYKRQMKKKNKNQ